MIAVRLGLIASDCVTERRRGSDRISRAWPIVERMFSDLKWSRLSLPADLRRWPARLRTGKQRDTLDLAVQYPGQARPMAA